jgi:hypothetical protein
VVTIEVVIQELAVATREVADLIAAAAGGSWGWSPG